MFMLCLENRHVKSLDIGRLIDQAVSQMLKVVTQQVNEHLANIVDQLLGRLPYQRRARVSAWIEAGRCPQCGSKRSQHFSRNGYRPRHLLTPWGELHIALPRVVCRCGGSVRLDFGSGLRPYQRLSTELERQIQRWGELCLSLRQMQNELAHSYVGHLGLQTLLKRLHQLCRLQPEGMVNEAPPILQLDAIWLTQLRPNGRVRTDAKGRRRACKGRFKRPLFIALGVWPETGHSQVLAWQLADNESTEAWVAFLTKLEEQGLRGQQGLKLIIHDGGAGLCTALEEVYFDARQQRCLFHKLRNIARAIKTPEELPETKRRQLKKAILKDFQAIWQAAHYRTALRRYLRVVRRYRHTQPAAVATLRRDFRQTLTYYHLQQQYPHWPRACLRTTSLLERFNENLRRRCRVARAFHSDQGALAMTAQAAARWKKPDSCPKTQIFHR